MLGLRRASAAAVLASALALLAVACGDGEGGASDEGTGVTGSGATFPKLAYSQWCQESGLCRYTPKGSGAGIEDLISQLVDFAGTDVPLTDEEQTELMDGSGGKATSPTAIGFPTLIGAVTVPNNIEGVDYGSERLRLSGETLASIFDGTITSWNAEEIASENPDLTLPNAPITLCVRADSSGTSDNFSSFLAAESDAFATKVGASKSPSWPNTGQLVRQQGNPAVAQCVQVNSNSIGYADPADAVATFGAGEDLQDITNFAAIRGSNASEFVAPSLEATTKAGDVPDVSASTDLLTIGPEIRDSSVPGAYPISTTTWVVAYSDYTSERTCKGVADMLDYFYSEDAQGQLASLFFAELPDRLLRVAKEQVASRLTAGGTPCAG